MAATQKTVSWMTPSELALPAAALLILAGMLAPVGPTLLDILLSFSIALSLTVVVVAASSRRSLDFSAFPTVLLVATLLRLSLNIASTRLILLHGDRGPSAAGTVIESFGRVLVGGNYAVGIVVFVALAIINFAVVTKGASRVAEVAARFTLDAMPGKQMAIDADLNAGIIGEEEARRRRRELGREGDFYAAMDGVGKFVRGDAVAAILIMVINLVAGLFIGIFEKGLSFDDAVHTYTILTIGDGLAAQIPALLTSTAAGLIVSSSAGEADLPNTIGQEFFRNPGALFGASALLGLVGVLPGLPHVPFWFMALLIAGLAYRARTLAAATEPLAPAVKPEAEKGASDLWPDILRLELGAALVPFVNEPWRLTERIKALRPKLRSELGIVMPAVRIVDNLSLEPNVYRIVLRGAEVARGTLRPSMHLAIPGPRGANPALKGIETVEPAFGLPALWIANDQLNLARQSGYTVADALTVLVTHFSEVVRANASEIITRKDVESMLEQAQKLTPRIVEELSGLGIHLGTVYRTLQLLLSERIPVADLPAILEAIAAEGAVAKDPAELAERIRPRIARIICEPLRRPDGALVVIVVDPELEAPFFAAAGAEQPMPTDPAFLRRLSEALAKAMGEAAAKGENPPIVVSPQIRRMFERVARRTVKHAVVLGANDIPSSVPLLVVGRVK